MKQLKTEHKNLRLTLEGYQRYLETSLQFIDALEEEGADTSLLRRDIAKLERKILELKLNSGLIF